MSKLFALILLTVVIHASGQSSLSQTQLSSALDTYIKKNYSDSWIYNRPAFNFVIDCTKKDTICFSVSNILQAWKYDRLLVKYYLESENNTVLIRLSNCCAKNMNYMIPISKDEEKAIKKKLVPDTVQVSSLMKIMVFYCLPSGMPVLIDTYIDNIDDKYLNLFPFPDAISGVPR